MNTKNPTTPHTPDFARLTIEDAFTTLIANGLDLPADRIQVGYFAAPKKAIISITGITSRGMVGRITSRASQVLSDAGHGVHFWDETSPAAVTGPVYTAQISVHVS